MGWVGAGLLLMHEREPSGAPPMSNTHHTFGLLCTHVTIEVSTAQYAACYYL